MVSKFERDLFDREIGGLNQAEGLVKTHIRRVLAATKSLQNTADILGID